MDAKKCDICGALYEAHDYNSDMREPSGVMFVNIYRDYDGYYKQDVTECIRDCCPKCIAAIRDTINRLHPIVPEPCLDEPIGEW